jgi:hypothetical protein
MKTIEIPASRTEEKPKRWTSTFRQQRSSGRNPLDLSDRRTLARPAGSIPKPVDVLAPIAAVGRPGRLA